MRLAPFCPDTLVSYILAIESDPGQAATLSRVVQDRVGAKLTVVDSKDGAIASIKKTVPDLILVSVLFSPRQEEELVGHLRTLEGADHLQTLTLPLLAPMEDEGRRRGLFGFRKKTEVGDLQGCDPYVFAEQILGYLKTAADLKATAEAARLHAARMAMPAPDAEPQLDTVDTVTKRTSNAFFSPDPEQPLVSPPPGEPLVSPAPGRGRAARRINAGAGAPNLRVGALRQSDAEEEHKTVRGGGVCGPGAPDHRGGLGH